MESPGFSKFRSLIDIWDTYLEEEEDKNKIRFNIESRGMIFFFEKDGTMFGTGEDGRVVFARIKSPDDDQPEGWEEEASFMAYNLNKLMKGEKVQHIFGKDELKKIKVLDLDDVIETLSKGPVGDQPPTEPKDSPLKFIKTNEE